jgi:hypothetical protein
VPIYPHLATVWRTAFSDRGLATIAIVVGVAGIWRAESLFQRLDKNLNHLIEDMKNNTLQKVVTVTASYAAFTRALQIVELDPRELTKDGAFALLTVFHFQRILNPALTAEEFSEVCKLDRRKVDEEGLVIADKLVKSGLGKYRESETKPPDRLK